MSTTTDKLALFKYDPRTDGTQTFNIQKALNDNWDKLDDAAKEILTTLANKAPGGFGWGEAMKNVLASDAEDTYETYCGKLDVLLADMPDGTSQRIYARGPSSTGQYYGAGNVVAVLSKILGTSASLIGLSPDPRGAPNGLWRMLKDNGKWQPVEWINPPMELGTEYRTTERYLGKTVYVKAVNFGVMPSNSAKSVSHGIANMDVCFMVYGHETSNHRQIPTMCLSGNFDTQIGITAETNVIKIHTTFDAKNGEAIVVMKYTKTTN